MKKIPTPLHNKSPKVSRTRGILPQHSKNYVLETHSQYHQLEIHYSFLILILEAPVEAIRKENKFKGIQIG